MLPSVFHFDQVELHGRLPHGVFLEMIGALDRIDYLCKSGAIRSAEHAQQLVGYNPEINLSGLFFV